MIFIVSTLIITNVAYYCERNDNIKADRRLMVNNMEVFVASKSAFRLKRRGDIELFLWTHILDDVIVNREKCGYS